MKKFGSNNREDRSRRLDKGASQPSLAEEHPIAVEVKNLSKSYGSTDILTNLSFEIPMGKVCVLLGPNGSGKTTLLKILAGLLEPTSGTVFVHGVDRLENPREARRNVGWMPAEERSGLYGRITGRENLIFFGALHGMSKEEMDRVIGNIALQMGIDSELDQRVLRVSSGAKQKIALARALIHNPPILLLDEPVRNLDPQTTLRFRRLLKDHLTRIQKKTVILSTHLLEEARRVADIIMILHNHQIVRVIEGLDLEKELQASSLEEIYLKAVEPPKP